MKKTHFLLCVVLLVVMAACTNNKVPPETSSMPASSAADFSSEPDNGGQLPPIPDDASSEEPASSPETVDPYRNTAELSASAEEGSPPSMAESSPVQPVPAPEAALQPEAASPQALSPAAEQLDTQLIETELLRLINQERAAKGIDALGMEDSMRWAARMRAPEVTVSFTHTRTDGTPYYTAFDEAGFSYAGKWHGENVTYMYFPNGSYNAVEAAKKMFEGLKESTGHYQNMLSSNFQQTGIGAHIEQTGNLVYVYSAQLFASL